MKILGWCIAYFLLITGPSVSAFAEEKDYKPQEGWDQSLLNSILSGVPFTGAFQIPKTPIDSSLASIWIGSRSSVAAAILPTIDFEVMSGGKKASAPVTLSFSRKGVLISSPLLKQTKYVDGARIQFDRRSRTAFFETPSHVNIFIGLTPNEGEAKSKGVLLCLAANLTEDGYLRPSSISFSAKGSADGEFLSGVQKGLAEARFEATSYFPVDSLASDKANTKDPKVSLVYRSPNSTALLSFEEFQKLGLASFASHVYFKNSGSYTRDAFAQELITIRNLSLTQKDEVFVNLLGDTRQTFKNIQCVGIASEESSFIRYGRDKNPS